MDVRLTYENGTIRVGAGGSDAGEPSLPPLPGVETDPRSGTPRAPAYRYAAIRRALAVAGVSVDDHVLDASDRAAADAGLPDALATDYELREYQREALDAWRDAGDRGVLELPTGAGKTVIAIRAMVELGVPTLVVVPTVDLLDQWQRELEAEFDVPIGRFGGGEQRREAITVSTYDSAYLKAESVGDAFEFVVFDEVHHLGGEGYRDVARLLAAPARLGLTATFERPDGAHETVAELIGERAYALSVDDLAGDHLAPYDIRRIEVELTPDERDRYDAKQGVFVEYVRDAGITFASGSDYQKLVRRSGNDPAAREALLAKSEAREIMMNARRKVDRLESILDRHRDDRVIVFTAHTDLVYRLSERFLLPAITAETGATERREILSRFREGTYGRVVAANVLDEGVDVPDANVAVVLSGSGSEREFTQRLGRVLRPKDDGGRAVLYEVVSAETAEERVASRRR
ncbi:type III restriction protein res subunit [Halorubrum aidingense JCM 13560]|uniref:DNA 3'-5' helicase n=1 Tax=Halorubrum aidingense JCM 13560 TaxID=1230454 RepID=M0PC60_9EURY|nr:DEAD/DEAH box helicase family protein [Halorubrum aidingense]EMA67606.1 type III restriction protein res subunit [Halorubrum aidingense JCM 13560]